MFAYLIGRIAEVTEENLVLEVGHIGFNVKILQSACQAAWYRRRS